MRRTAGSRAPARQGPTTCPPGRLLAPRRHLWISGIPAHDLSRRQALVRYLLRPPFAPSQVSLDDHGNVVFRLAHPFSNGTTHFVWRPDAFLARLAALIPRPRRYLLTYHGVLAVITDPPVIRAILIAIGRDPEPPQRSGPRAPPGELFSI